MAISDFNRNKNGSGTCLNDSHNKVFLDKIDEIIAGANLNTIDIATNTADIATNAGQIDLRVEQGDWNQNGFTTKSTSTLIWTDSTPDRTLSIQPTVTDFEYFIAGVKYMTTGDVVQITDVEGIHAIYYDGSTLTALANPTPAQFQMLILSKALVSILYWDTSEQISIYVGEERHGKGMSPSMHNYLHQIYGLVYLSGLGLNTMSVDGSGTTADAQFGVDEGDVVDEDIHIQISAILSTVGLPIYHMLGVNADWQRDVISGFSMRTFDNTSATRLCFNEYTGGAWQLTEVSSGDFVLGHIFATTEKDKPMIMLMGQNEYTSRRDARAGANVEVHSLITNDVLFPEIRPIATIIFQTNLSYVNDINAIIVSTDDGDDYVDWRSETISRLSISTDDHNSLTNLQLAQAGVTYGHIDDGSTQVIAGTKTFSEGIILPTSSAGLPSGTLWNSAGTPTIVP
jgi:hypothetical protein